MLYGLNGPSAIGCRTPHGLKKEGWPFSSMRPGGPPRPGGAPSEGGPRTFGILFRGAVGGSPGPRGNETSNPAVDGGRLAEAADITTLPTGPARRWLRILSSIPVLPCRFFEQGAKDQGARGVIRHPGTVLKKRERARRAGDAWWLSRFLPPAGDGRFRAGNPPKAQPENRIRVADPGGARTKNPSIFQTPPPDQSPEILSAFCRRIAKSAWHSDPEFRPRARPGLFPRGPILPWHVAPYGAITCRGPNPCKNLLPTTIPLPAFQASQRAPAGGFLPAPGIFPR